MSYPIFVNGVLNSKATITDEHLEMLNVHLKESRLGDVATADRDEAGNVRIVFAFEGDSHLHFNPSNFAFGESIARVVEISEEIELGFHGFVTIAQSKPMNYLDFQTAQEIEVNAGKTILSRGTLRDKEFVASGAGTLVQVIKNHRYYNG